jgi:transcriptional regulator with XRE-family HTH domain
MTGFNGRDLASRVAGLIQGQFKGDIVAASRELDVDPQELRRILEDKTNRPDLDLLAKLVKRFGVDLCWLITGEYDWRTHMRLLEDEDEKDERRGRQLLSRLAAEPTIEGRETLRRLIG